MPVAVGATATFQWQSFATVGAQARLVWRVRQSPLQVYPITLAVCRTLPVTLAVRRTLSAGPAASS